MLHTDLVYGWVLNKITIVIVSGFSLLIFYILLFFKLLNDLIRIMFLVHVAIQTFPFLVNDSDKVVLQHQFPLDVLIISQLGGTGTVNAQIS